MSARIYIEGGGKSKELHSRCREGFRRLFEKCGYRGRMPRLVACGSREEAFRDFQTAHAYRKSEDYVAMLIDSEDPVRDIEKVWDHLTQRDGWRKPDGAEDGQVLLMTTCMETWIATDRGALQNHYGSCLQENALPNLVDIEQRGRHAVQDSLAHATRRCKTTYTKGAHSFLLVAELNPDTLKKHLPSFARCARILSEKL